MAYILLSEAKDHLRADFDDDDTYIDSLIALVEELILIEIQGSTPGEGTVTTAGTISGEGTAQTAGTVALAGTLTNFTDFNAGDKIFVAGETTRTIATITDDTHLTVTVAFSTTASGLTYIIGRAALTGVDSNFTDYIAGDTIKVEGEALRTIATITDDTHLTVTVAFSTTASGLTYIMHPGIPSPIPKGLRQAMLLMIGHFYLIREPVIIGVSMVEVPFAYKYLIAPYKNYTIA